ncbi:MAG: pilus assembly protein [Deltaproteobacteria bacterium HGW-Deltaproteobacteria-21]|jgi:type IV pilus assembly protein PilA|nr:MAG: pilus assembly protein [Deltaproteobacteria bacterium HGW-Deltaproteobacteria-21]
MFSKLHMRNEKGFTLIELMIVIAIIGILAAIAIPQFSAYRVRSYNSSAQADLRNAATAEEAYFVDVQSYTNDVTSTGLYGSRYGLYTSDGVTLSATGASNSSYQLTSWHSAGNKTWSLLGPGGSVTGAQ